MNKGPVIYRVLLVPMKICTQTEGERTVAIMPAWTLPKETIADGLDIDDAVSNLREKMAIYWLGIKP
jgi:hypothetical protein